MIAVEMAFGDSPTKVKIAAICYYISRRTKNMADIQPKIATPERENELGLEKEPKIEKGPEVPEVIPQEVLKEEAPQAAPVLAPTAVQAVQPPAKDPILEQVEGLLADDLLELYAEMPPNTQAEFKAKGEEVASKIQAMIKAAKVVAKEVLELIVSWLKIIPGVNKFFLEQEAKIKTDKILALAEEEMKKQI